MEEETAVRAEVQNLTELAQEILHQFPQGNNGGSATGRFSIQAAEAVQCWQLEQVIPQDKLAVQAQQVQFQVSVTRAGGGGGNKSDVTHLTQAGGGGAGQDQIHGGNVRHTSNRYGKHGR